MGVREQAGAEALRAVAEAVRRRAQAHARLTCGRHPQGFAEGAIQQAQDDARLLDSIAGLLEEDRPLERLTRLYPWREPQGAAG